MKCYHKIERRKLRPHSLRRIKLVSKISLIANHKAQRGYKYINVSTDYFIISK